MTTTSLALLALGLALFGSEAQAQTTVAIAATDDTAAETTAGQPANPANIRITRTGSTAAALTVWVKVSGSAVQGVDYTFPNPIGSFVIIPAGSAELDIPVNPRDDFFTEGTETVRMDLEAETAGGTPVPYTIGASDRARVNLLDNEDPNLPPRAVLSLTVLGSPAREVASNSATFRIVREGNLAVALDVHYTLAGTGTPGADFVAPPGRIAIPAGATFADVTIVAINDTLVEEPETIVLTLTPHPNVGDVPPPVEAYVFGGASSGTVTLISEDLPPPPVVTITSPVSGSSQSAPGTLNITFEAVDPVGHISRYALTDGATVLASNLVTHPVPPAPGTPFTLSLMVTNVRAGLHVLRAKAWSNLGALGTSASVQAVVTNIPPVVAKMSVSAIDAEAAEGLDGGGVPNTATFAITVDRPMPTPQYVVYRLSSPGPGYDFNFPTNYSTTNWPMFWPLGPTDYGYAYFPTGVTRVEVVVTPVDDAINEGTETLTLTLSYPFVFTERTFEGIVQFTEGGFFTPPFDPFALPVRYFDYDLTTNNTANAVILDNDTEPTPFAIVAITTTDGDAEEIAPSVGAPNPGVFTVSRVGPTNLPLTVNYSISGRPFENSVRYVVPVQALHGVDYVAIPHVGTAVIPAGATSTEIVITPIHDSILEPNEYVQITLLPSTIPVPDPSSYLLYTNSTASLVIRDLVLPAFTPVVWIRTLDGQAIEENTYSRTASFVVERNGSLANAVTVTYAISGTASNGVDYELLPGFVTLPAGSPRATITVTPIADGVAEPFESVGLTLQTPPSNVFPPPYVLSASSTTRSSAGVTIRDTLLYPGHPFLTRQQRALRHRFPNRFAVVPLPVAAILDPAVPPPANVVAKTWAVEASSDLVLWVELGLTNDPEEYVDVTAGDVPQRFYRFREVPPVEP